jgi:hypothetical protein
MDSNPTVPCARDGRGICKVVQAILFVHNKDGRKKYLWMKSVSMAPFINSPGCLSVGFGTRREYLLFLLISVQIRIWSVHSESCKSAAASTSRT